jgi:acetylornithine deacetylase/succinyl-diaminopimelate desuccinylase-like protein
VTPDPLSRESIVALAQELIRIPSVNPALAPDGGHGEAAVARHAQAWLEGHGVRAWLEQAAPGRPNVVAEVTGGPGPVLVLCAHLDTVDVTGMEAPFEPRLEGDRLYGRGSFDMKGAAAAAMSAAAALTGGDLQGTVALALVADEEYASVGASAFVRDHRADACILTEASELALVLAHRGFVWAEIVCRGRAAHGSRWDLGVSAIGRAGRIVAALEAFDRDVLRARTHPLTGPASLHCAMIEGGVGWSTYAPECRVKVERRTLPGESPDRVLEELQQVVRGAGEEADVVPLFDRPPLECPRDSAIARCAREALAREAGRPPRETGVPYWMDAAIFAAAGIPTVNLGPSGAGAHEPVEWVDVSSLVRCARVLTGCGRTFHRHAAPTRAPA